MNEEKKLWLCADEGGTMEIKAETAQDAAQEYVDGGEWGEGPTWVDVQVAPYVEDQDDAEWDRITIQIDAEEPDCEDGREHDWQSPYEVLGGIRENPGVWGNGGGVVIREVCACCGRYRIHDTWAQRPDTGEQGLETIAYEDADEASTAWSLVGIREALGDLTCDAMDISHGIYLDADRIADEVAEGKHSRDEAVELLDDLRERLEEAKAEQDDDDE